MSSKKNSIISRIDAITGIESKYMHTILPAPRSVKIELTAICDLKCFFCATSKRLREKNHMDYEFFKKIAKDMRDSGVEELGMFYLGESMLYPKLPEAILHAKQDLKFPYIFLTTNGVKANKALVYKVASNGLDSLKFSLNSANRQEFIDVTQVDAFDIVVQNIKDARISIDRAYEKTGHKCGLYASSIKYDGEQSQKMQQLIDEIKPYVDEHYFLPLYGQAGLTAGEKGTKPVSGNTGRADNPRSSLPCWSVFTEGHVTWDGKLSACCFDHNDAFTMADLNKVRFMEGWNSIPFQQLREHHLAEMIDETACKKCIATGEVYG